VAKEIDSDFAEEADCRPDLPAGMPIG